MYEKLGYSLFRIVNKYYSSSQDSSGEDAYGIEFKECRYEEILEQRPGEAHIKANRQKNIAFRTRISLIIDIKLDSL